MAHPSWNESWGILFHQALKVTQTLIPTPHLSVVYSLPLINPALKVTRLAALHLVTIFTKHREHLLILRSEIDKSH